MVQSIGQYFLVDKMTEYRGVWEGQLTGKFNAHPPELSVKMMVYGLVGVGVIGVLNTCNIFFVQKTLLPTKQEYIENVIYTNPTLSNQTG